MDENTFGGKLSRLGNKASGDKDQMSRVGKFKLHGEYCRLISLGKGLYTIVSDLDFERLNQHSWRAMRWPLGDKHYAVRSIRLQGRQLVVFMGREVLGIEGHSRLVADYRLPAETMDNSRWNLRAATRSEDQHNHHRRRDNSTGYKGVSWDKQRKKYVAQIKINGKNKRIGFDKDPAKCHEMYMAEARILHGEFHRVA